MHEKTRKIEALIETVHRLRAPGGCPWDREQTHQSLRPYLIEEAYEMLDVLDKIKDAQALKDPEIKKSFIEEMGDVWMQVLLHSEMAGEQNAFDIYDVAEALNDKLVRRHPHVFGDVKAGDSEAAFQTWEKQKAKEKSSNPAASVLDGVPRGLPALQKTSRMIEKATKVGFQWSDLDGPLEKIDEELAELKEEIKKKKRDPERVSHELGDLLFSVCNLAHLMKISPEDSLRSTLDRFNFRFRYMEKKIKEQGRLPEDSTLEEMDKFWNEAKRAEKDR